MLRMMREKRTEGRDFVADDDDDEFDDGDENW